MTPDFLPVLATTIKAVACTSLALMGIHGLVGPAKAGPGKGLARALGLTQLGLALMLTGEPARSYGLLMFAAGLGLAAWSSSQGRPESNPRDERETRCLAC